MFFSSIPNSLWQTIAKRCLWSCYPLCSVLVKKQSEQCAHLVANDQISNGRRKEKPLDIQSGIIWCFQVIMSLSLPFTYSFVQLLSFVGYISKGKCTCSWNIPSSSEEECRVVWPMPAEAGLHWRAVVISCEAVLSCGGCLSPHGAPWSCQHYAYSRVYKRVWEAKALFSFKYCFALQCFYSNI